MNAMSVIRLGLARGGIELRHTFTYLPDLLVGLFFPLIQILVLFLMRGHHVPGTTFSLGSLTLPSIMGDVVRVRRHDRRGRAAHDRPRGRHAAARQGHAERDVRLRPREDHR